MKIDALKLEQLMILWRNMRLKRLANCRWYECRDRRFTEECRRQRESLRYGKSSLQEMLAEQCRLVHLTAARCLFACRFNVP
ncbi:unnamed protein product [Anisakis simplex]|uniref:Uncharacterized protein n=1 Tax=Anisakis simplex TaxID=6269 RepID=A0A3P6NIA8_ANISI|nr:unnamed protein product [Anisakis simplex]